MAPISKLESMTIKDSLKDIKIHKIQCKINSPVGPLK